MEMDEEKMLEWTMMAVEAITSKGTHGKYLLRIFHMYILDKPFDMFILQCIVEVIRQSNGCLQQQTLLRLALEWNRPDLAKADILVEDHRISKRYLAKEMLPLALQMERTKFVEIILRENMFLKDYVNINDLKVPMDNTLQSILPSKMRDNDFCDWTEIRRVVKKLLHSPRDGEDSDGSENKNDRFNAERPVFPQQPENVGGSSEKRSNIRMNDLNFLEEQPYQEGNTTNGGCSLGIWDLFIWSIFTRKTDLTLVLWKSMPDRFAAAVAVQAMCGELLWLSETEQEKLEFHNQVLEYREMAMCIIDRSYEASPHETRDLLLRKLDVWGELSCLEVAARSEFQDLVAHPCAYQLVREKWIGKSCVHQPAFKFFIHVASYLMFLLLFTYVLVFNFYPYHFNEVTSTLEMLEAPNIYEWILLFWILSYFCDEIFLVLQMKSVGFKNLDSLLSTWNDLSKAVGLIAGFVFLLGFCFRFYLYEQSRSCLSLSFFIYCLRIIHFLNVFEWIGPKIVMFVKMMFDLAFVIIILAAFLVAYGVSSQASLYPNENRTGVAIAGIFYKPYWQLYGDLFLEEIAYDPVSRRSFSCTSNATELEGGAQRCPESSAIAPVFSAIYMLMANIMLLNLLIALFSLTVNKVYDKAEKTWKFQYYKLVEEYNLRCVVPAPISLIFYVVTCIPRLAGRQRPERESYDEWKSINDNAKQTQISLFDDWCTETYLREKGTINTDIELSAELGFEERFKNLENSIHSLEDCLQNVKSSLHLLNRSVEGSTNRFEL